MKTTNQIETEKAQYKTRLELMDNDLLFTITKEMIWLSAYANNNPRSAYHWQVDMCYDEWHRRELPDKYTAAYNEVYESLFGKPETNL